MAIPPGYGAMPRQPWIAMCEMIMIATMLPILISGLIAGPARSM
jgi:hypothetical protein